MLEIDIVMSSLLFMLITYYSVVADTNEHDWYSLDIFLLYLWGEAWLTWLSQSHHYGTISCHSLVIITTSYSILINDVILHYLTPYTYNLVWLLTILILHILYYYCTICSLSFIMGSFLELFCPLLIVSSTCTNNTLDVYKLGPYDLKY